MCVREWAGGSRASGSRCLACPSVASCLCHCACLSAHLGRRLFILRHVPGVYVHGLERLLVFLFPFMVWVCVLSISVQVRGCVHVRVCVAQGDPGQGSSHGTEHGKLVDWQASWGPGDGWFCGETPALVLWPPWVWAAGTGLRLYSRRWGLCYGCACGKPGCLWGQGGGGAGVLDPLSSLPVL